MPKEKTHLINGTDVPHTECLVLAGQGHESARLAVAADQVRKTNGNESAGAAGTTTKKET